MKEIIKKYSKTNINSNELISLLDSVHIFYYYIYSMLGLIIYHCFIVDKLRINIDGELIDLNFTTIMIFFVINIMTIILLKTHLKTTNLKNIKDMISIYLKSKKISPLLSSFEISSMIQKSQKENIDIIFEGVNSSLKYEAKIELLNFEKITNKNLIYYLKKGYYKEIKLSTKELDIITDKKKNFLKEKIILF
jgi:hypothetical protein